MSHDSGGQDGLEHLNLAFAFKKPHETEEKHVQQQAIADIWRPKTGQSQDDVGEKLSLSGSFQS
jgi:hypothetical protein